MEFRFTITMTELGRDDESAERVLDGFLQAHPEVGPVVSRDARTGYLTVVFSLDADSADLAIDRSRPVFAEGGAASGLSARTMKVVAIHIDAVTADDPSESPPQLQLV